MAKVSELSAKVNLNADEAITGLKAIQREAKEATRALKELERVERGLNGKIIDDISIQKTGKLTVHEQQTHMSGTYSKVYSGPVRFVLIKDE